MKYGFIGCGNMGGAIAKALSQKTKEIMITDRSGKAKVLAEELFCTYTDPITVAASCERIFLAVKPQFMDEALKTFTSTKVYRELLVAANWKRFFKSKTRSIWYEPIRFSFFVLSRLISSKSLINIINKKYKNNFFDNYKFVGAISGSYREKEIMSKEFFDEYITLSFENCEFKAIKGWDKYLTKIYGDYMKLPPKNKQVSHHTFKAYYKD